MKYVKSFGDFLLEKEMRESGSFMNESTKWTKDTLPALEKFINSFKKMAEGEYDPKTARTSTAIDNIWEMAAMFFMNSGRTVWVLQNPDKCKASTWDRVAWKDGNVEDAEKWSEGSKKYIESLKSGFEMSVDAISAIEKGNADKLESVVTKLAKHMDATYKLGKKNEKQFTTKFTAKPENSDEMMDFFFKFHNEMLDKLVGATSNEKAIENLKNKAKSK
jgi:hypothetical protein